MKKRNIYKYLFTKYNMKNKKYFLIPLLALVLVGVFAFGVSMNQPSNNLDNMITYNSMVKTETTGNFEGRISPAHEGIWELVSHEPNQLYDTGKEAIEDYLGEGLGGGDAFDWIELCNSSTSSCGAPSAGKTEVYSAHTTCGMSKVAGTQGTNAASGNWTVYNEFTSTCDSTETNVSRLINADGDDLAGNSFTAVTLQNGDKLNVTWDCWVT